MADGFTAKQIFERLKPINPNTTLMSVSVEVSKQKKKQKAEIING
jgi:hypothetical protein